MIYCHFCNTWVIRNVSTIKRDMRNGYPYTVNEAQKKAMPKISAPCSLGYDIGAKKKDGHPKYRFDHFGDKKYGGKSHYQSKD